MTAAEVVAYLGGAATIAFAAVQKMTTSQRVWLSLGGIGVIAMVSLPERWPPTARGAVFVLTVSFGVACALEEVRRRRHRQAIDSPTYCRTNLCGGNRG